MNQRQGSVSREAEEGAPAAAGPDPGSETLDDLILGGLKYIQARQGYRFSVDSILLAHFAGVEGISRAVDLGAGGGLLSLLIGWRQPDMKITAVEFQEAMAGRARRNIALNGRQDQIMVLQADVVHIKGHLPAAGFQLTLCNPPFFPAGSGHPSQNAEENRARHESSATLADFVAAAAYLLERRGRLAMVLPAVRLQEALHLLQSQRLFLTRLRMVHSREGAAGILVLLEAGFTGRRSASILPPLFIYEADGSYTAEIKAIYGGANGGAK